MRYLASVVIIMMSVAGLRAQTAADLDSALFKARQELDAVRKEFTDSADAALAGYLEYEAKLLEEYRNFRDEMMQTWGDTVAVESSRKEWVEYSPDRKSRSSVNWENGKVSVEVLVDPSDDEDAVRQKLEKAVADLIASKGSTVGFESSVMQGRPISDKPLLEGQLDLAKYGVTSVPDRTVSAAPKPFEKRPASAPRPGRTGTLDLNRKPSPTLQKQGSSTMAEKALEQREAEERRMLELKAEAEAKAAAEAKALAELAAKAEAEYQAALQAVPAVVVASQVPVVETVKTSEGVKNVVTVTMELVEDHLPKRAAQFKDIVNRHTSTYAVDAPLVYAVMEQESAFNPAAQSWVPAYGLMQLVPKSGGRDAYRYVHKTDQIPTAEFLFDPDNNVQLGTGYLKLLMSTTFSKVTDPMCRMLCAIAAYNTGAGNVSRAVNGTTNISKAIPTINAMSYDQLFDYLKANLPHAETKDYIQKVTSKMQKYIK